MASNAAYSIVTTGWGRTSGSHVVSFGTGVTVASLSLSNGEGPEFPVGHACQHRGNSWLAGDDSHTAPGYLTAHHAEYRSSVFWPCILSVITWCLLTGGVGIVFSFHGTGYSRMVPSCPSFFLGHFPLCLLVLWKWKIMISKSKSVTSEIK